LGECLYLVNFNVLIANILGLFLLPVTWQQFARSSTAAHFLLWNVLSSGVWAASMALTGQGTAALVSLSGAIGSLGQWIFRVEGLVVPQQLNWVGRVSLFIVVVCLVFMWEPPSGFWSWLALGAFAYMRFIEILPQKFLRWLVLASPCAWIAIALHAQAYTLIPGDAVAFLGACYWLWCHYRRAHIGP